MERKPIVGRDRSSVNDVAKPDTVEVPIPSYDLLEEFGDFCKTTDIWGAFTNPTVGTWVADSSEVVGQRRQYDWWGQYFGNWLLIRKLLDEKGFSSAEYPDSMYDYLDSIRGDMVSGYNDDGHLFHGITDPSAQEYKIRYQALVFGMWALEFYHLNSKYTPPPVEHEFTANERQALKGFASTLEATQEYVPD